MTDVRDLDPASLRPIVEEQPYPVVFATVSGAHLYGFASRDSDVDLRGVHLLPAELVVGLRTGPQTLDRSWVRDGVEMDLVRTTWRSSRGSCCGATATCSSSCCRPSS